MKTAYTVALIVLVVVFLMVCYDLDARLAKQRVELMFARHDVEKMEKRLERIEARSNILIGPHKALGDTSWFYIGGLKVVHIRYENKAKADTAIVWPYHQSLFGRIP